MHEGTEPDLCVIGAGAAGLTVAAIASELGVTVVLIEADRMGGECLNTGCVPSKALLAAAKAAHGARTAAKLGVNASVEIDFARVHGYVRSVIDAIAPHDSAERFEKLGVKVIKGHARLTGARAVSVDGAVFKPRRLVIATGSAPAIPPIPGLEQVEYLTNENIFEVDSLPSHLVILGGGAAGVEIGQAFRRFGSNVTIIERGNALSKDDQDLSRILLERLSSEGIAIREGAEVLKVEGGEGSVRLTVEEAKQLSEIRGSHLLVATGRRPRLNGFGLEVAGIRHSDGGILVDRHLQTNVRGIFAAGDVVDGPRFTHVCGHHAGVVIKNALFHISASIDYRALPWVTYTDPELAHVGLTEKQARKAGGGEIRIIRVPFSSNDRAQAEGHADGLVKIVADQGGRVLGASIVGANAGELIHLWVVAIEQRLKLRSIASMFAPYPTWGELNKAAGVEFAKPFLRRRLVRTAVKALSWIP